MLLSLLELNALWPCSHGVFGAHILSQRCSMALSHANLPTCSAT